MTFFLAVATLIDIFYVFFFIFFSSLCLSFCSIKSFKFSIQRTSKVNNPNI